MITKRELSLTDFSLWSQYFDPHINLQNFEKMFIQLSAENEQDKSYSFILEEGAAVVGFIQVFNVLRGHSHSGMIEVMITDSKRKSGYGKLAIKLLEEFSFKELGLLRLIAPVSAENTASIALFTSLGYEKLYTDPSAFFFKGKPGSYEIYAKLSTEIKKG